VVNSAGIRPHTPGCRTPPASTASSRLRAASSSRAGGGTAGPQQQRQAGGGAGVGGAANHPGAWGTPKAAAKARQARPCSAPPRSRAASKGGTPSAQQGGFQERLQGWEHRRRAFETKTQKEREEKEREEVDKCTFCPSINTRSEFYARRSRGCLLEPFVDRLHHEADKRTVLRQKAKELLEADEMGTYPFKPTTNESDKRPASASASAGSRRPGAASGPLRGREAEETEKSFNARCQEDMRWRRERQAQRECQEKNCSFQPRISEKSDRIVRQRRDEVFNALGQGQAGAGDIKVLGPVEERLYADAQAHQNRRGACQSLNSEPYSQAPTIDDESKRICRSSVYFQGPQQDFLTRQQTFELAKQKRMEVRAQHCEAKSTFRPEISDVSRQIVSNNIDLIGETPEERVNRLAVGDVERRDHLRGQLEQFHYRECTFQPSINPASQQLLASRSEDYGVSGITEAGEATLPRGAHERLYRSALNRSRSSDDTAGADCTFKPKISSATKRFAHVKPHYARSGEKTMEHIEEDRKTRDDMIRERRRVQEEQERSACTFTPKAASRPYEEPQKPVVVSGLGRFFELKDIALRQRQDQQEREARAFGEKERGLSMQIGGVTIPEPFKLSGGCGAQDQYRAHQKNEGRGGAAQDECTFTPLTNETENRRVLRQMLRSS